MFRLLVLVSLVLLTATVHARPKEDVVKEIAADPLWQEYYSGGGPNSPEVFKMHGAKNPVFREIGRKCSTDFHQCKWGWDAFLGKGDPVVGKWLKDVLEYAVWADEGGGGGDRYGKFYASKIGNRDDMIRAATALAIFPQEGGADALAATLKEAQIQDHLWGCGAGVAYRGLWLLGAKQHFDTMLAGMQGRMGNEKAVGACKGEVISAALPLLDTWTLTPEQKTGLDAICAEMVLPGESLIKPKAACMRYLGLSDTTNTDAHDFIVFNAQGNDNYLKTEGIRAAGRLGLKDAKETLQAFLAKSYNEKTTRVKKGKKYKEVKTDTWKTNFHAVPSAVALFGMGDKTAGKAIDYWMGFEERGGKPQFTWSQGFAELAKEANWVHPKKRKALAKKLSKAFAEGLKHLAKNPSMANDMRAIAMGLAQMGDKKALEHLIKVLKSADKSHIRDVLRALGGAPSKLLGENARGTIGTGRLPIGAKDGFKVKDAEAIIALIKKRLKFWTDAGLKQEAIEAAIVLQAQIDIANNNK